jgi:hypothetical protein
MAESVDFGLRYAFEYMGPETCTPANAGKRSNTVLGTILIVILILALLGALPRWPHSRDWGYYPTGGVGFVLMIIVVLLLLGRL